MTTKQHTEKRIREMCPHLQVEKEVAGSPNYSTLPYIQLSDVLLAITVNAKKKKNLHEGSPLTPKTFISARNDSFVFAQSEHVNYNLSLPFDSQSEDFYKLMVEILG